MYILYVQVAQARFVRLGFDSIGERQQAAAVLRDAGRVVV